jgi:hypothetical protein
MPVKHFSCAFYCGSYTCDELVLDFQDCIALHNHTLVSVGRLHLL